MAIQFFCTACGQPIEVDDNMANLVVTCPYCQKVVTAPGQSDLTARPQTASAGPGPGGPPFSAAGPAALAPGTTAPTGLALGPPKRRTVVGWISLACMLLAIGVSLYSVLAIVVLMKDFNTGSMTPAQLQEVQVEAGRRLADRPGLRMASLLGMCILPVAAVALAIAALVTGGRPRWPAITTLVILGLGICLMCAGVLISAGARGAGG